MSFLETFGKCSACRSDFHEFDTAHTVVDCGAHKTARLCTECAEAARSKMADECAVFTTYERADGRLCDHGKQFSDEGIMALLRETYD